MQTLQVWLVETIGGDTFIADLMRMGKMWAFVESLHFLGLCLLVGAVGTFDLRLLGLGRRAPIAAVHRLLAPHVLAVVLEGWTFDTNPAPGRRRFAATSGARPSPPRSRQTLRLLFGEEGAAFLTFTPSL